MSVRTFVIPFYYGPVPLRSVIKFRFRYSKPKVMVQIPQHCNIFPSIVPQKIRGIWTCEYLHTTCRCPTTSPARSIRMEA